MARIAVSPQTFTMVTFDAGVIARLAEEVADRIGLPAALEVQVNVDEGNPLGRTRIDSLQPVTLYVQGGAFENPKVPRTLSEKNVADVLGRMFHRVADRLAPSFAEAPSDDELTMSQQTAWDTYAVGRCERLGYQPQKARRLYHFRNRHGFSDVADTVFERLWSAEGLSWADLDAACAETASARETAA